ncbi:hypothetical protein AALA17_03450 [Lactobacillaceae bacterium 24-114]
MANTNYSYPAIAHTHCTTLLSPLFHTLSNIYFWFLDTVESFPDIDGKVLILQLDPGKESDESSTFP